MKLIALFLCTLSLACSGAETAGSTRVAKWKFDKAAAFMLMFDDSMTTQVKNVVPELKGRGLIATFYVNPGGGGWKLQKDAWEKTIPEAGMEYGNHTFTHKGILDMADGTEEISKCNDVINSILPGRKKPRLISFGVPGVPKEKWKITPEQLKELLAKHNMVQRPNVSGRFAEINLKTADQMLKIVDDAIAKGEKDLVAFHGVGGEWLACSMPTFVQFVNGVVERKEKLWISDHISVHQYETERSSATVEVLEAGEKKIALKLSTKADPQFYDAALTLITQVPAAWKKVSISQGAQKSSAEVANGSVRYEALPGNDVITLQPE
ncbi:MAG TPA: polysaccharide deacetylase family protein [Planctomycetota bacterium]|nr:polysaccharide deacetylase family protein [Planctomycetota bacterium]